MCGCTLPRPMATPVTKYIFPTLSEELLSHSFPETFDASFDAKFSV